jgi:multimeric flavodoxin WrbA
VKVLGIACSGRKSGNSEILLKEALSGAREQGAEIEMLTLRDKEIRACDGCDSCLKKGKCHIEDDMQPIYEKLLDVQGIIMSTPVYFWSMNSPAKLFIDRTYSLRYPRLKLANKVGGVIAVAGRWGHWNTCAMFSYYFATMHMLQADAAMAFASEKGSVRKDKCGMKAAWELGRQVVLLIETRFQFPSEFENVSLLSYVQKKYGISTSLFQ